MRSPLRPRPTHTHPGRRPSRQPCQDGARSNTRLLSGIRERILPFRLRIQKSADDRLDCFGPRIVNLLRRWTLEKTSCRISPEQLFRKTPALGSIRAGGQSASATTFLLSVEPSIGHGPMSASREIIDTEAQLPAKVPRGCGGFPSLSSAELWYRPSREKWRSTRRGERILAIKPRTIVAMGACWENGR